MFIKRINKSVNGSYGQNCVYRLVESYRYNDMVRHHTILNLGALTELPDTEQKRELGLRIEQLVKQESTGICELYQIGDQVVEQLAQQFFQQIKQQQRLDLQAGKDLHTIHTDSVKNNNVREAGAEWLCLQALQQLGIPSFLRAKQWEEQQIQLALTHIVSRAAYPASELRTSKWIQQNSAICELTGYPAARITKDRLYHIARKLYEVKDELEQYLSRHTNELFDLDDKIIIYDLTNTYFEGTMRRSKIARFGRSKEKRSDARLIVLAIVVNTEGFLKYSQTFEGNMADTTSLKLIIEQLSARTSATGRKPVVVMDAGIASEGNLALLRTQGYDYMCVSRAGMNKYQVDTHAAPVRITDKKEQPMTLQRVQVPGKADTWLRIHSPAKAIKELGMSSRFSQAFEQGLMQIQQSLSKKGGVKKRDKVWERIGRLKARYPSIHKHYQLETAADAHDIVTELRWTCKPITKHEGYYLLRTTLNEQDERTQWTIYNTIREIEASFRVLKTDLDLRPVYHKSDEGSLAHLHLGLLAYWIVNTVRHQLKQKGNNTQWKDIVRTMNTQKMVTTTMDDKYGQRIEIRQCSEPIAEVASIYQALGYRSKPFSRKKSVVPLAVTKKLETHDSRASTPP